MRRDVWSHVRHGAGGRAPRRVLCTGYCVGGDLADVAAPWALITWPDADVRCVTFGAEL